MVLPPKIGNVVRRIPLTAIFGIAVIVAYIIVAFLAPLLAPYGERDVLGDAYLPWSQEHLFGTDSLGRDMFSRLLYGARNTVGIAFVTTALAFAIGASTGLLAATIGGWLDQILSRIVDILISIPALIFAMLLLSVLSPSVINVIGVIAVTEGTRIFRVTRAVALDIVVMDYIESARMRGASVWRLVVHEILPNAIAPLMAEFGLRFCFVFLAISALSFLGLGIQPPTADWGSMVRENASLISFGDVTPLLPAAAIALLTVAVNFVIDWVLHISSGLKE